MRANQLWTTTSNVKMKGLFPVYVPLDADALIDGDADAPIAEETRNLEAAIAASLGERHPNQTPLAHASFA